MADIGAQTRIEAGREVWHHGWIGGLLAVTLAAFDELAHLVFPEVHANYSVLWYLAVGIIVFFAALLGIVRFERHLLKKENWRLEQRAKSPILLNVGDVCGDWLDAVYKDTGDLIQGSIIEFSSTRRDGFTASGRTYDLSSLDPANSALPDKYHPFNSQGREFPNGDGFYYVYGGAEGKEDHGVGYYRFNQAGDRTFQGAFLSPVLDPQKVVAARYVIGRQASDQERALLRQGRGGEVLRAFLTKERNSSLLQNKPQGSASEK